MVSYCVDPSNVGADLGEDGWLLEDVAARTRAEAHRAMDGPGSIRVLAVQGTPRVSLQGTHTRWWKGKPSREVLLDNPGCPTGACVPPVM